jgi:hypothetical protein
LNVDAGGQFGNCNPDGVCDGNDAFHALNAFGGTSVCACPLDGGPAPTGPVAPVPPERAKLRLVTAAPIIAPGQRVEVDVYLHASLSDLRGYQLHAGVSGGANGMLDLVDISIEPPTARGPRFARSAAHVFTGAIYWDAYNLATRQMVAGLDTTGRAVGAGYLATFVFRATPDAAGSFVIELLHDDDVAEHRTFLFPTPAQGRIVLERTPPLEIRIHD